MKWITETQVLVNQGYQEAVKMKKAFDVYPNNRKLKDRLILMYQLAKELEKIDHFYNKALHLAKKEMDKLYKNYIYQKHTSEYYQRESLIYQQLWAKAKIELLELKNKEQYIPTMKQYIEHLASLEAELNI